MRRTEDGLIPTALAIAGALQWVASWGGAWLVSATTRSTVSAGSGGMREGRVLSRVNPSIPSYNGCAKLDRRRTLRAKNGDASRLGDGRWRVLNPDGKR